MNFCKNSVFCILFLVFFFLGTICGIFIFYYYIDENASWLSMYMSELSECDFRFCICSLISIVRPFLLVYLVWLTPVHRVFIFVPVFCRGMLFSFCLSAQIATTGSLTSCLLLNLIVLPLFFSFCRYLFWLRGSVCSNYYRRIS